MESALYGIYALVVFVSEISLVRCAHSFDFWYKNNSCVNTVRQHFLWSILFLLSISKKQQQPCTCAAHFFVHLFDHGLHDYNVKLPNSFYLGKCRMCSPMFCRVPVHFFSTLPLVFTLLAAFSYFLIFSPPISMFFLQRNLSVVFCLRL